MSLKILNNSFYLLPIFFLYLGCNRQAFSEDKFVFDFTLNNFFKEATKKDTIYFENSKNSIDTFILTKLDSIIVNPNQNFCLPCPAAVKSVFREYKQYPINYWAKPKVENGETNYEIIDEEVFLSISKHPQDNRTTMHLSFKNFVGEIKYNLGVQFSDTLRIGKKYFTNYYILNTYAQSLVIKDEDVESVYVTPTDGIIAYREKSGILRKRKF